MGYEIRQFKKIRKGYNVIIVICGITRSAAPLGDEMYRILANSSCTWMCVDCGLPSFSDSLFETSLDLFNSFSSLELLSQETSQQSSFTTPSNDRSKEKKRSHKNNLIKLKVLNCNSIRRSA